MTLILWDRKMSEFLQYGGNYVHTNYQRKNWNENVKLIETHIWYMEFQTHPQNVCFYVLGVFLLVMGLFFHDLKTRLKHANILIRKLITILLTKNFCTFVLSYLENGKKGLPYNGFYLDLDNLQQSKPSIALSWIDIYSFISCVNDKIDAGLYRRCNYLYVLSMRKIS